MTIELLRGIMYNFNENASDFSANKLFYVYMHDDRSHTVNEGLIKVSNELAQWYYTKRELPALYNDLRSLSPYSQYSRIIEVLNKHEAGVSI